MPSIAGSTVLITGASSGIGRATALAFAAEGARILVCARREDALRELEPDLKRAGAPAVHIFPLDVRDRESVEKTLANLPPEWKNIDILVNNAGLSRGFVKVWDDDPNDWQEMMDTNVLGLLYVTRAVVPGMIARGKGHVISLGSIAGHMTYPNGAVYCASKAAEKSISEGLKIDLLGTPIRVTSVDPGMVETEFSTVRFHGDQKRADKVYERIDPLHGEDIADAIVWAATRPPKVNIHSIVLTPIDQVNPYLYHRHD